MAGKNPRFFYGYIGVSAAFAIMTLAWGSNRSFGVFVDPMLEEFGWTRAAISGSFTINVLVMGCWPLSPESRRTVWAPESFWLAAGCLLASLTS